MKRLVLGLAAAALTVATTPALAQSWGSDYWRNRDTYGLRDYPEFRGEIAHIRGEISQGINEGWLDDGQARQIGWRLRQVQFRETREFRFHGWSLPDDDRAQIRSELDQLDHWIDRTRDRGGEYGWGSGD